MSSFEHQATVDKGLKMKIKRKTGIKTERDKHEVVQGEGSKTKGGDSSGNTPTSSAQNTSASTGDKSVKIPLSSSVGEKDKSPIKAKGPCYNTKRDKSGKAGKGVDSLINGGQSSGLGCESVFGTGGGGMEPKVGETAIKRENAVPDPYEFNAKVEDGLQMPMKKIKMEKPQNHDIGTETSSVAVATEPDCLGPCEPGTSVTLEGIVWTETENGVLVVNVTWRGKTYVGTLLDATRHDWAPPRFNSDSPVDEFEMRTPKGRGKRGGRAANTPVNEPRCEGRKLRKGRRGSSVNSNTTFQAPPSPAKSDVSTGSGIKRKGRPMDIDLQVAETGRSNKRCRSGSSQATTPISECPSPTLIECPEPNCNKKYKHINGLRYHQSHAHGNQGSSTSVDEDSKDIAVDEPEEVLPSGNKKEQNVSKKENSANKKENSKKDSAKDVSEASDNGKSKQQVVESATSKKEDVKEESKKDKDVPTKEETKDNSKLDLASKKKEMPVSTASSTKTSVSLTKIVSTGFQVSSSAASSAPSSLVTSAGVVSISQPTQSSSQAGSTVSVVSSTKTTPSTAIPITVTAITALTQNMDLKSDISRTDKNDARNANRAKSATRPIMPAPSANIPSVTVTHTALAPVTTHAQVSSQLIPIQPKPTVMGDPVNNHPALAGLRDKNRKPRKPKNEKDSANGSGKVDQVQKGERAGVIKATPQPSKPQDSGRKDIGGQPEVHRVPSSDNIRSNMAGTLHQHSGKGMDLSQQGRQNQPPTSLLKVGSPLQLPRPENSKTPITDDVQSPAYSDISDANESTSPAQNESPQKNKEEAAVSKKEEAPQTPQPKQQSENSPVMPHYGMYSYPYGQSPYHMSNMSPGQKQQQQSQQQQQQQQPLPSQQQQQQQQHPPHPHPHPQQQQMPPQQGSNMVPKDISISSKPMSTGDKPNQPDEAKKTPQTMNLQKETPADKDKTKSKLEGSSGVGSSSQPGSVNMSQQQVQQHQQQQQQEYVQQQKWLQHMYAMQSLPPQMQMQYQYLYGGYPMDPNYMHHYEKTMEEQRRQQQPEPGKGDRDRERERDRDGMKRDEKRHDMGGVLAKRPDSSPMPPKQSPSSTVTHSMLSEKSSEAKRPIDKPGASEKELKEQALKEKQNENRQILKENIDLKAQMDKSRQEKEYERYRKAEEIRRYQMYQQQKMIEERKKMELAGKGDSRPENLSSKVPGSKPISDQSANRPSLMGHHSEDLSRDHSKRDHSRDLGREHGSSEGKHRDNRMDVKHSDNKSVDDKSRTPVLDKNRGPETPRSRPSGSSSKSGSPATPIPSSAASGAGSVPSSPSGSYPPYMNNYPPQYIQSSQYGHMPVDPYRGMNVNPALMGYPAPNSAYIHPSQMGGFSGRVGVEEEDKMKASVTSQKGSLPSSGDSDLKKPESVPHNSQYYGNVHKIHELQEKGRPSSRGSSPGPQKPTDSSSSNSAFDKHRDYTKSPPTQRHVHTHHHTHVVGLQPGTPAALIPPVYDPYSGAVFNTQSPGPMPHQFPPK